MIIVKNGSVKVFGVGADVLVEYAALTDSLFETLGSQKGEEGERMVKAAYKTGKKSYKDRKGEKEKGEDKNENHI